MLGGRSGAWRMLRMSNSEWFTDSLSSDDNGCYDIENIVKETAHTFIWNKGAEYLFQEPVEVIQYGSSCSRIQEGFFCIVKKLGQLVNNMLGGRALVWCLYADQTLDGHSKPNQQPWKQQKAIIGYCFRTQRACQPVSRIRVSVFDSRRVKHFVLQNISNGKHPKSRLATGIAQCN